MSQLEILQRLETVNQGMRRVDGFRELPFLVTDTERTGKVEPYGFGVNEQWVLTASLQVTFWAASNHFLESRKAAEQVLVRRLYGDVLGILSEIKLQINSGDRERSLDACAYLERLLTT